MIPTRRVLAFVREQPWAILPEKLETIVEFLSLHAAGVRFSAAEVQERIGAARQRTAARQSGAVALLPIHGTLTQRANVMTDISGGTSLDRAGAFFRAAVADPAVSTVVLDIDSPGGSVYGVQEFADEVYKARDSKRIVAVANSLAASAAYWIGSQAHEFLVTPSGEVGSIGVLAVHADASSFYEAAGLRHTIVKARKYKAEGSPFEPLSEEAHAALQTRVDEYYRAFVKAVSRGRARPVRAVIEDMGQGRVLTADDAVRAHMVDRVATLDSVLSRFGVSAPVPQPMRATETQGEPVSDAIEDAAPARREGGRSVELCRRQLELILSKQSA